MSRRSYLLIAAVAFRDISRGSCFVAPSPRVVTSPEAGLRPGQACPVPLQPARIAARPRHSNLAAPLNAVVQDARKAPILVTGNNVEVTEPIREYVEKKVINVLDKVGSDVSKVDVHLSVEKNPRVNNNHNAEVTVFAKNHVIRATDSGENMYACVDLVTDRIRRKLRRFKERKVSGKRQRQPLAESSEEVVEDLEASAGAGLAQEEQFEDNYAEDPEPAVDMSIVKRKSFPMPPINVDDAMVCLDYIDHDYTNEVNVVYKRKSGGVGLIEPERDQ